jgi:hypothetical protein
MLLILMLLLVLLVLRLFFSGLAVALSSWDKDGDLFHLMRQTDLLIQLILAWLM